VLHALDGFRGICEFQQLGHIGKPQEIAVAK
jgi:hypothetical protein